MTTSGINLPPPFTLVVRDRVGSTNDEARRLAEAGAPPFTVVWAKEQNSGRGRLGRQWVSSAGNLYCSILLDGGSDPATLPQLSFVAGLAVAEALTGLVPGAEVRLKWPNDVLLDGLKVSGMLLERTGPLVVLGVGVNIVEAPLLTKYPATCLAGAGSEATAFDVLVALCEALAQWMERWRISGFAPVRASWMEHAAGLGRPALVSLANGTTCQGRLIGLDGEGALLLDTPDGERRRILAGDVFFAA